jgi:KipI family sensor histidine kinase inhibitor
VTVTPSLVEGNSEWPQYRRVGECGLLVEFANRIEATVNAQVRALLAALDAAPPLGLRELIPAYRTLLIIYDPLVLAEEHLLTRLKSLVQTTGARDAPSRIVTIPALYGGEHGPDLDDVAAHCGLPPEEVVVRHSGATYLVYFIGFSPGYPYLGGLDPALATPRLASPRLRVPAGAVAIGGQQTGVYPQETPGGWRIIGRTPIRLYDPQAREPFRLRAGDRVRFRPIGANEYEALLREAAGEPTRNSQISDSGAGDGHD